MKKSLLLILVAIAAISANSQDIFIFHPDSTIGIDARIHNVDNFRSSGKTGEMVTCAWTWNGTPGITRSMLKFDLSNIKKGTQINKATLYLYGDIDFPSENNSTLSGSNEMYVQRIIEPWEEHSVLWSNQPKSTSKNQVITDATTNQYENFEIDVTDMVQDMVDSVNYGFLFKLVTEEYYRCVNFASTDNADSTRHPKLEVRIDGYNLSIPDTITINDTLTVMDTITINDTLTVMDTLTFIDTIKHNLVVLQPDGTLGKDARIHSTDDFRSSGKTVEMVTCAWTWDGKPGVTRSLLEFDLSRIRKGYPIEKAMLHLYGDVDFPSENNSTLGGSNEMNIQRITEPWREDSVLWSNQPKTTTKNQVTTDATTNKFQNFSIDVTNLVQDMVDSVNHGFMFSLVTEQYYRCVNFASSDHSDESKRPRLEIMIDTTLLHDTLTILDTITVNDTVQINDTILVNDTILINDTIIINDTLTFIDTLVFVDTLTIMDTLIVINTDTVIVYDSIQVSDTLIIDVLLTDNSNTTQNKIRIYPNPAKDNIVIDNGNYSLMNNYRLLIHNSSGSTVFESEINQQTFILNVNQFGSYGMYFVQIIDEYGTIKDTRKIILE